MKNISDSSEIVDCRPIGDFTVLLPTYNRVDLYELFDMAISSVYANSILPKETIVVVDGPVSLDFRNKITYFQGKFNFTVFWLPDNLGLTGALNYGLRKITTKYTFRADGDDFNMPNRFAMQLKILDDGFDLVGGYIQESDRQGNLLKIREVPLNSEDIRAFAKFRNPFNHMSVAFRTDVVRKIGGYPELYLKEDYGLWALLIGVNVRLKNLPLVLVRATAGDDLFKRRSGIGYIRSEWALRKHLHSCGVSSWIESMLYFFIRIILLSVPPSVKGLIYSNFLRTSSK
jgi:glycosyltransferase involved in cell wall biosynthesis